LSDEDEEAAGTSERHLPSISHAGAHELLKEAGCEWFHRTSSI
jgi:hypothetical protein